MKLNWKPITTFAESFLDYEEAISITIIKSGFENLYVIIYDDAFKNRLGECDILTREQIKEKFGITIKI